MLSIEVNFLTGRYVAAAHYDRGKPEWPPHPARLFSAMVATWADSDNPDPAERTALEWLEKQTAPSISAPDAAPRSVATHYVPVNDTLITSKSTVKSAVQVMPPGWVVVPGLKNSKDRVRTRYPRWFPSVTLIGQPRVTFAWNIKPSEETVAAIDRICARLTRLGHSSSLVSCRVATYHPTPNHAPGEGGSVLRYIRSGQLTALELEHRKHQASRPRILPYTPVRYRKVEPAAPEGRALKPDTVGEWLVMAFLPRSRRFPSTMTVNISKTLRDAVLHHAADPIPEGLSGHRREGRPSTAPHAAFLPLPWVGHEHADGRLMGAAISMPESLDSESRRAVLRAIGAWESDKQPLTLTLGRRGLLKMERIVGPSSLVTLRPNRWSRKSHQWVSALPIALPAHPGPLGVGTAAARSKAWARAEHAVTESCRHIGLPEPIGVTISLAPLITGTHPATVFPAFRQGGSRGKPIARRLVHASVLFDRPVAGPVMLGAGRYLGLGLMFPVSERKATDA